MKKGWITNLAEVKIRLDRGNSLVSWGRNIIIIIAGLKIIVNSMTTLQTVLLGLGLVTIIFLIGWFDLKYVKLMQKESELATSKYNPHLNRLKKLK
mgnify:CR=1 FL=1